MKGLKLYDRINNAEHIDGVGGVKKSLENQEMKDRWLWKRHILRKPANSITIESFLRSHQFSPPCVVRRSNNTRRRELEADEQYVEDMKGAAVDGKGNKERLNNTWRKEWRQHNGTLYERSILH